MRPITFCIPTAKNEKEYVLLLLKSLIDNTQHKLHEFLVFVDSDNQNTFETLQELKAILPSLKIYKNDSPFPIGGQRNISTMFNAAKNDVVCYLQSDMIVSKDFDIHLNESLTSEDEILCFTRIEPPLHPASPEKIVMDFGLHPADFKYEEFLSFSENLQKENRPNTLGHFAPFAVFKNTWINVLGGFDTQFRCSREDSDVIIRLNLNNIKTIQTWRATVYHFTCVSSRGHEWFKQNKSKDSEFTLKMQSIADQQELKRFIRKWGYFGHEPRPIYDTTLVINIDEVINFNILKFIEPFFKRLIINDESVVYHLREQLEFEHQYFSNFRWKYSYDHWQKVKHLFNPPDWSERVQFQTTYEEKRGVVVKCNYSALNNLSKEVAFLFENIHKLIDENEVGKYEFNGISINIFEKLNLVDSLNKNHNLDLLLREGNFIFS